MFNKITNEDLEDRGVMGLPATPELSVSELQRKFDEVGKEVIVPKFNSVVDLLNSSDAAESIGAKATPSMDVTDSNVQKVLNFFDKKIEDIGDQQGRFENNITERQDEYESKITKQQDDYEDEITNRQNTYETNLSNKENAFEADLLDRFVDNVDGAVNDWLNEHPEATTTVQDGSIAEIKIQPDFLKDIKNDYATPQKYGAIADGVHDDTQAVKNAIENNNYIFFPSGTYLIDFSAFNLTDKKLFGASSELSKIKDKKGNVPFGLVGKNCKIENLGFECKASTAITGVLQFGRYQESFIGFGSTMINNLFFNCNKFTIPIFFNCMNGGSWRSTVSNIYIDGCYDGLKVFFETIGSQEGWATNVNFDNIIVRDFHNYAFNFELSDSSSSVWQFSHGTLSRLTAQATNPDAVGGFHLIPFWNTMEGLNVFNDSGNDDFVSVDFAISSKTTTAVPNIYGGFLEGKIGHEENMKFYHIDKVNFRKALEGNVFQINESEEVTPYDMVKEAPYIQADLIKTYNCTYTIGSDWKGDYLEITTVNPTLMTSIGFSIPNYREYLKDLNLVTLVASMDIVPNDLVVETSIGWLGHPDHYNIQKYNENTKLFNYYAFSRLNDDKMDRTTFCNVIIVLNPNYSDQVITFRVYLLKMFSEYTLLGQNSSIKYLDSKQHNSLLTKSVKSAIVTTKTWNTDNSSGECSIGKYNKMVIASISYTPKQDVGEQAPQSTFPRPMYPTVFRVRDANDGSYNDAFIDYNGSLKLSYSERTVGNLYQGSVSYITREE